MKKISKYVLFSLFLFSLVLGAVMTSSPAKVVLAEAGPDEDPDVATIVAQKVVCADEVDLPNWGVGGVDITSTTATDYVASHPNCQLASNWDFEWSLDGVGNPGDSVLSGGTGWTTFSNTTNATVPAGGKIWVREQFDSRYVPFTGENTDQNISAEIYCHNDVLNYDNWEWIDPVEADQTYYCVAFNAPKTCSVVSDEENIIEGGTNAVETWDDHTSWYQSTLLNPAKWIWDTLNVVNPTEDETKVFIKEFNLDATPLSASIDVAADNGFILEINGVEIDNKLGDEFNYGGKTTYPVSNLVSGKNTIRMTVKNFAMTEGTAETNPAGALYKLTVLGSADCANVVPADMCLNITGHQSTVPTGLERDAGGNCIGEELGSITIHKYDDLSGNGSFDTGDVPLSNWFVFIYGDDYQYEGPETITDSEGKFVFNNLKLQDYNVCEYLQEGWINTGSGGTAPFKWDPETGPWTVCEAVTLDEGNKNIDVYFGNKNEQGPGLVCDPSVNLIANGSFENPIVTDSKKWQIFPNGTSGLAWLVDLISGGAGDFELQAGYSDWLPSQGSQYAELDATSTVKIWQNIPTIPGKTYKLKFAYSPRPEVSDNRIEVYADSLLETLSGDGASSTNTSWEEKSYDFVADNETKIEFKDISVSDSLGGFIDNVELYCQNDSEPPLEPNDVCSNIDGLQETVPAGKVLSGGICIDQSSGGGGGSSGGSTGSSGFISQILGVSTTTGRVLGESTCAPYLKSYIKLGAKNDKEDVKRLQTFLNEYLGLKLKVNGLYTASTYNAVKKFQVGARGQVLTPWVAFGLSKQSDGTGYVYKTTKRWINMLKCPQLGLQLPKLP